MQKIINWLNLYVPAPYCAMFIGLLLLAIISIFIGAILDNIDIKSKYKTMSITIWTIIICIIVIGEADTVRLKLGADSIQKERVVRYYTNRYYDKIHEMNRVNHKLLQVEYQLQFKHSNKDANALINEKIVLKDKYKSLKYQSENDANHVWVNNTESKWANRGDTNRVPIAPGPSWNQIPKEK